MQDRAEGACVFWMTCWFVTRVGSPLSILSLPVFLFRYVKLTMMSATEPFQAIHTDWKDRTAAQISTAHAPTWSLWDQGRGGT